MSIDLLRVGYFEIVATDPKETTANGSETDAVHVLLGIGTSQAWTWGQRVFGSGRFVQELSRSAETPQLAQVLIGNASRTGAAGFARHVAKRLGSVGAGAPICHQGACLPRSQVSGA